MSVCVCIFVFLCVAGCMHGCAHLCVCVYASTARPNLYVQYVAIPFDVPTHPAAIHREHNQHHYTVLYAIVGVVPCAREQAFPQM